MELPLKTHQRQFALQRMAFGSNLLSPEVAEALRRACLACAENQKKETGIIDFLCGLYLHFQNDLAAHFTGDFAAVVSRNFSIHRFGHEGLVPKNMLDGMTQEDPSDLATSFFYSVNLSDELLRLLWLSAKLASAVGKKASLMDVVAAAALDGNWTEELLRNGLKWKRFVADFDRDVRTIIFHAAPHTTEGWPKEMDFEHDGSFQPPFTLELSTPSGPFQPVRSARVKLNEREVATVEWPEKPTVSVIVELRTLNKIKFELDGPSHFASVEVTVRGTPAQN
jgi:hypothetical protein